MVLWTPEHIQTLLPALGVMLVLAVLLRLWLGKKELRYRIIPLQVVAVILLLLEIGKQWDSFSRGYDLYHIPLHYCSLVLITLPLMAFYRGKHAATVREIACGVCAAVTLLTVIYPDLIYGAGNIQAYFREYQSFHTVTFHNLAIFACFLMLALNFREEGKAKVRSLAVFILVFCVVSATTAQLLETNYNNFYTCNIPPLEQLRQAVEAVVGTLAAKLLYVVIVTGMDIAFTLGAYSLYRFLSGFAAKKVLAKV